MGFLTPSAPKVEPIAPPPPGPRNRADPSITLAGLRVGRDIGSLSQQAATAFKSGGLLGDTRGGKRKRTLIGGSTA